MSEEHFHQFSINIHGVLHTVSRPLVMGILNVTPDSFYSGSRCADSASITARVKEIISEGADIIDIGGYSTRPGCEDISPDEEFSRLSHGLEIIHKEAPKAIISVDTFRAEVARQCVEKYGVDIINDIGGGTLDNGMFSTIADLQVPYILMHMRGTPQTMSKFCDYSDVTVDVITDLAKKVDTLKRLGVCDIILDPGFGFSKTVEQNYELMRNLSEFLNFDLPVLVGISRKSMIFKSLGCTSAESLNGTTVLNTYALMHGAAILRVHDVRQAVEAVKLVGLSTKWWSNK
ncbi:MAG: dihydropteroate synthase [Muribaculaceae bacterium]|jgi:dihydropteroate synthase|nr:dihydropteroate synthase [Muribaculaceae bacterium]